MRTILNYDAVSVFFSAPGMSRPALPMQPLILTGVVLAHALTLAIVLQHPPSKPATASVAPLYVQWISEAPTTTPASVIPAQSPAAPLRRAESPQPAKPRVQQRRPEPPASPPVVAASAPPTIPLEPASPSITAPPQVEPAAASPPTEMSPPATAASPASASDAAAPPASGPATKGEPTTAPPRYDLAYLSNPRPNYPSRSVELGEEGTVVIEAVVTPEGRVKTVRVRESSGYPRLDRAALTAVRRWRFQPSMVGDTPVEGIAIIPMPFTLKNQ